MNENTLNDIRKLLNNENTNVRAYLLKKIRNKDEYLAVLFPNDIEKTIKRTYSDNYSTIYEEKTEITEYDTVHSEIGKVKVLSSKELDNLEPFICAITDADGKRTMLKKENFSDNYSAIAFVFEHIIGDQITKAIIISKYKKIDTWFKKGIKFAFLGNTIVEKNDEILVLNGNIDVIIFGDKVLVFNERSFETIFNYYAKSKHYIESKRDEIESWTFINDPKEFYNSITRQKNSIIILARALKKNQSNFLNMSPSEIKEKLSGYQAFSRVRFDEQDRIVFDKESRKLLLNLLRSTYTRDLFSDKLIQTKGV